MPLPRYLFTPGVTPAPGSADRSPAETRLRAGRLRSQETCEHAPPQLRSATRPRDLPYPTIEDGRCSRPAVAGFSFRIAMRYVILTGTWGNEVPPYPGPQEDLGGLRPQAGGWGNRVSPYPHPVGGFGRATPSSRRMGKPGFPIPPPAGGPGPQAGYGETRFPHTPIRWEGLGGRSPPRNYVHPVGVRRSRMGGLTGVRRPPSGGQGVCGEASPPRTPPPTVYVLALRTGPERLCTQPLSNIYGEWKCSAA